MGHLSIQDRIFRSPGGHFYSRAAQGVRWKLCKTHQPYEVTDAKLAIAIMFCGQSAVPGQTRENRRIPRMPSGSNPSHSSSVTEFKRFEKAHDESLGQLNAGSFIKTFKSPIDWNSFLWMGEAFKVSLGRGIIPIQDFLRLSPFGRT